MGKPECLEKNPSVGHSCYTDSEDQKMEGNNVLGVGCRVCYKQNSKTRGKRVGVGGGGWEREERE